MQDTGLLHALQRYEESQNPHHQAFPQAVMDALYRSLSELAAEPEEPHQAG